MILQKPLITEKSINNTKSGNYTFAVEIAYTKNQIKSIIEKQYKVNVIDIKTISMHGKSRKNARTGRKSKTSAWKKAIVKIAKDQKIPVFEVGS